jgi:micrococcal nuclease
MTARRRQWRVLALALALLLAMVLGRAPQSCAGETRTMESDGPVLIGRVTRVGDGDTIEVSLSSGPIRVRLHGIDTPESNQPWGREARVELLKRVDRREVALAPVEQDQYDRMVAVVYLGDENVNRWLVEQGHAWAYRAYLDDPEFCELEARARGSRRGLWSLPHGDWVAPWEWRRVQRGRGGPYTDFRDETAAKCISAMRRRPPRQAGRRRHPSVLAAANIA